MKVYIEGLFFIFFIFVIDLSASSKIVSIKPSPISNYERVISLDDSISYILKNSSFTFEAKYILDLDSIYYKGEVDNYDDAYISDILENQVIIYKRYINSTDLNCINIVFKDYDSLKKFDLDMFKDHNINLYILDRNKDKINFPLLLEVYPFFIVKNRFVQGVINSSLLESLFYESDYSNIKEKISLAALVFKLEELFPSTMQDVNIEYDEEIYLYKVYKNKKLFSYVSLDGRYIILAPQVVENKEVR